MDQLAYPTPKALGLLRDAQAGKKPYRALAKAIGLAELRHAPMPGVGVGVGE